MKSPSFAQWDRVSRAYRANFDRLLKIHERIMSKAPSKYVLNPNRFKLILAQASKADRAELNKYWAIERKLNTKQKLIFIHIRPKLFNRMKLRSHLIEEILAEDMKNGRKPALHRKKFLSHP